MQVTRVIFPLFGALLGTVLLGTVLLGTVLLGTVLLVTAAHAVEKAGQQHVRGMATSSSWSALGNS